MTFQLPSEVHGVAAGVLAYSFLALICSALMVWLVWSHQERTNHVACISYLLFLSTSTCIISQLHDFVQYSDVVEAQWRYARAHPQSPEIKVSNGAIKLDLGLWYFRQYAYSAASMLVLFWAFSLMQSVYGWSEKQKLKKTLQHINSTGKVISIILPILTICLLQSDAVQQTTGLFFFLANVILMLSLLFGIVFMLAILGRYIHSRRRFLQWSVGYGRSLDTSTTSTSRDRKVTMTATKRPKSIYDRWLMTRFTIAFIILSVFEFTNILFQLSGLSNSNKDATLDQPDLSVARARETAVLFLPGPAPSFLLFIVFGTTTPCRKKMRETFVPKRWQRRKNQQRDQDIELCSSPKVTRISENVSKGQLHQPSPVTPIGGNEVPLSPRHPPHHPRNHYRKDSPGSEDAIGSAAVYPYDGI
ncbi:hypothetical protein F5Y15DRAFT_232905 [Xylariaceae sp. FL0016]|nr:hypothetical protein F5Y15DRAFT_232905 [Xylariaceae sp. FL0016]